MSASRADVRQALATALTTALPSAQAVYGFQKGGFAGQTPVVRVMSDGSSRQRLTPTGGQSELFYLVQLWVLYTDPEANWHEEDAENALDQLEYEVAVFVNGSRSTDDWQALDYGGRSMVRVVRYQGEPYLVEDIPVVVKVY